MSNTAWAMATLSLPNLRLCDLIAEEAVSRGLETFAPQAVSNIVWAFAVLEFNNHAFMSVRSRDPTVTLIARGVKSLQRTCLEGCRAGRIKVLSRV